MIACDVGGVRQWLEDKITGLLVPPHDIPALVQAIGRLTEDPALAAQLGQAGQAKVAAEFRAQQHVETLRGVLDRVAGLNLAPHQ
jgi:glycosyltransferase involved in cell wall biosynthesis